MFTTYEVFVYGTMTNILERLYFSETLSRKDAEVLC